MLDIVVVNRNSPASLFRNLGAKTAMGPPADGQLARDRARRAGPQPQRRRRQGLGEDRQPHDDRTVEVGGGHASGQPGFVHVGLGTAERAEIRIKWPDGEQSYPYRVFANQFVVVDRTKEQAAYWYPGR